MAGLEDKAAVARYAGRAKILVASDGLLKVVQQHCSARLAGKCRLTRDRKVARLMQWWLLGF